MRLTPAQVDALVADYAEGGSVSALARKHRVHINTATAHLERRGIAIRPQHGIPANKLEEAQRLRAEGWTYEQIGQKYGTSRTSASNQLRGLST